MEDQHRDVLQITLMSGCQIGHTAGLPLTALKTLRMKLGDRAFIARVTTRLVSRNDPDFILGIDADILIAKTTFDGYQLHCIGGSFDGNVVVNYRGLAQVLLG